MQADQHPQAGRSKRPSSEERLKKVKGAHEKGESGALGAP